MTFQPFSLIFCNFILHGTRNVLVMLEGDSCCSAQCKGRLLCCNYMTRECSCSFVFCLPEFAPRNVMTFHVLRLSNRLVGGSTEQCCVVLCRAEQYGVVFCSTL